MTVTQDVLIQLMREGADAIEQCIRKAERADPADVPFLGAEYAAIWHRAQAEAYRHALDLMEPPAGTP